MTNPSRAKGLRRVRCLSRPVALGVYTKLLSGHTPNKQCRLSSPRHLLCLVSYVDMSPYRKQKMSTLRRHAPGARDGLAKPQKEIQCQT